MCHAAAEVEMDISTAKVQRMKLKDLRAACSSLGITLQRPGNRKQPFRDALLNWINEQPTTAADGTPGRRASVPSVRNAAAAAAAQQEDSITVKVNGRWGLGWALGVATVRLHP